MNLQELLQQYPKKYIKPSPGMAVTATVWEEAHQYHRQCHSFLTLFSHGPGILTGLEVVASDPPETAVYILPGVAIDPAGRIIVVSQPVAYDIGRDMEGLLYLLLGYGESRPRADNGDQQEGAPLYITAEFSISAQTGLPDEPRVDLARIRRSSRDSVFLDAPNPVRPGADEIDLRFRREVGAPPEITMAVCYLGQVTDQKQGVGAGFLAQAVNHMGRRYRVVVENDVPIGPNILPNTLVYLVGQGGFELDSGVMKGLRNYVVRRQGTLFIEGVDAEAENSFLTFLREQELLPAAVEAGHPLLLKPHLFNEPPPGFEPQTQTRLLAGDGIIFSPFNYGLIWQGAGPEGPVGREQIRTAIEWGENILTYALERRRGR